MIGPLRSVLRKPLAFRTSGLSGCRAYNTHGYGRFEHDSASHTVGRTPNATAEVPNEQSRLGSEVMSGMWDPVDEGDPSPICPHCGVSALPAEAPGEPNLCENADCEAFGEPI